MKTFVGVAVLSAVVSLATVLVLQSTGAFNGLGIVDTNPIQGGIRSGDDDRPPVVVSGGSVFIEQLVDAKDYERGAFTEITKGDKKSWTAGHERGSKPKSLSVIIDNSTTATTECGPKWVHRMVESLTFTFTPSLSGIEVFTAKLGPAKDGDLELQFHFPVDVKQVINEEFRLELERVKLTKVTIGTRTCDLGPRGRVEIRQRKQ